MPKVTEPALPAEVKPIVQAARRAIRAAAPDAEELFCAGPRPRSKSMMWKLYRYLLDGKPIATIGTFTAHSSIFFAHGAALEDPAALLQGTGKSLRYVTLRTAADLTRPALRALLKQAFTP